MKNKKAITSEMVSITPKMAAMLSSQPISNETMNLLNTIAAIHIESHTVVEMINLNIVFI